MLPQGPIEEPGSLQIIKPWCESGHIHGSWRWMKSDKLIRYGTVILILIICRYLFTLTYTKCACKCINFILEKKKGRKWYTEGLFSFDWSWIILCSLLVLHLQFCLYVLFDCMNYTFYFLYQIIVQILDNFSCTEHAVQQWFMYWMFNKG